jgi:4-deoxy-L-threo-5-hexosulose-uronate ketol-isomerase
MEIRQAIHPAHGRRLDTEELRTHFLVESLFTANSSRLVYSYDDRLIVGGICPHKPYNLMVDEKIIGSAYLLQRREMGVVNVGGQGTITVDEDQYDIAFRDGLYIGKGAQKIAFESKSNEKPAKFYFNCVPAHAEYPTTRVGFCEADPIHLGEVKNSNKRTIRKYIHPDGVQSCQLVMGMTTLHTGCIWNTMPVHTHPRRMEAYFYFDLSKEDVVFHFMGEPSQTRHLIVRNEEAVLSPNWSIHSGAGTGNYTIIWGMAGENQSFTDMDHVPMRDLK